MAIAVIFEGADVTQAQYDAVRREVVPDNKLIPGMLYHVAGPMNPGWRVVEVWESQQAADKFFTEKLGQSLQKNGISIKPSVMSVHNIFSS